MLVCLGKKHSVIEPLMWLNGRGKAAKEECNGRVMLHSVWAKPQLVSMQGRRMFMMK